MSEAYQMKVCGKCGDEFEASCELEFDSETICPKCRIDLRNGAS